MYKPLKLLIVVTCLLNFGNSLEEIQLSDSTTEVVRVNTTGSEQAYKYYPVKSGTKRISFKVRAESLVHLILSDAKVTFDNAGPQVLEVLIDFYGSLAAFRLRSNLVRVKELVTPKYLSANEYRGFWVQWTDDNLYSVGRESETVPFIEYKSKLPLSVKYFGILTWATPGSWILYGDSGVNNQISYTTSTNVVSEVIKIETTGSEHAYKYIPVLSGTNRITFQVRADKFVHLMLTAVENSMAPEVLEILIDFNGQAIFRQRSTQTILKAVTIPKCLNANEYRGFWVHWTDDYLFSVGRVFETVPFIEYKSSLPLSVKYFGVQTWLTPGSWNINGDSGVITNQISYNTPSEVIRVNTTGSEQAYKYYPITSGTKCFSFQVRAESLVHLILSDAKSALNNAAPEVLEILIDFYGSLAAFRLRSTQVKVKEVITPKYLNAKEYRGFWVRWTDDNLYSVGRESETVPFIEYKSTLPLSVKYFGILTWFTPGSWILYGDQKCPAVSATPALVK